MNEVCEAGYTTVDLGPYGYFPTDPKRLSDELAKRSLVITSGFLFEPFHDLKMKSETLEKARKVCRLLQGIGCRRLVVMDCLVEPRAATAGRNADARRLSAAEWKDMMSFFADVARVTRDEFGMQPSLHAHAGTYVEFEDEVDRAMNDLPDDLVGLCVDTGHTVYAGFDPAAVIERYGSRIRHLHFKDVDPVVLAKVVAGKVGFMPAVSMRVFCPLGDGAVDFGRVRGVLDDVGYTGWATIEQDVDSTRNVSFVEDARRSLDFLRGAGIAA
jgi:inosose dehydratase